MQSKVNELYKETKDENKEIEILNLGTPKAELNSKLQTKFESTITGANISDETGFKYFSAGYIKDNLGTEGISYDFLINIEEYTVLLFGGIKYEGKTYYTAEDFGINVIKAEKIEGTITFNTKMKYGDLVVYNIQGIPTGVSKYEVKYKYGENGIWHTLTIDKKKNYTYTDGENNEIVDDKAWYIENVEPGNYYIKIETASEGLASSEQTVTLKPALMRAKGWSDNAFWSSTYKTSIKSVRFTADHTLIPAESNTMQKWNVRKNTNSSDIWAYLDNNYNLIIYSPFTIIMDNGSVVNANNGMMVYFYNFTSLKSVYFDNIDTSQVKDMSNLFRGCSQLTYADVSKFDTSNVESMLNMFAGCKNLTTIDVSKFNTSNVKDMSHMFYDCRKLTSADVSNFDTKNVTQMDYMFYECRVVTELDVSGFNTSKVATFEAMFYNCQEITVLDVSNFDTSKASKFSNMFNRCPKVTKLDVSGFDTSSATKMNGMFIYCIALTQLDVSGFNTSKVKDMSSMFYDCYKLTEIDVSNFDTKEVTTMSRMFYECYAVKELDVSGFNTSKVTEMNSMFLNCYALKELDLSSFDTSLVTDMTYMLRGLSGITELDLSSFNTSIVTTMQGMFLRRYKINNHIYWRRLGNK